MDMILIFLLWFLCAEAVLTALQLTLRKKKIKRSARIALIAAKALLAVLFAFLPMAGPVQLRAVQPFMMAMYVALRTRCAGSCLRCAKKSGNSASSKRSA